jgi:HK97 family phage major capsid protein
MTGTYNELISRSATGSDPLVPEPLSADVWQEAPKMSAALSLMRTVPLSAKTERLPVLDVLPISYWVGGDTGLEQTSLQEWKGVTLVVEQLATIIPIPVAYMDDTQIPIWAQVLPRMGESAGKLIDQAIFWGANIPSTWGTPVYPAAIQAGNYVQDGFLDAEGAEGAADFGQSVAALGDHMSQTGYDLTAFAARPGLKWRLAGMRSEQGNPIFQPDMTAPASGTLYGYPISMPLNGSWDSSRAQLLAGDFSKAIIGMRQDMTYKMLDQAVISDDNGKVILNLAQQNAVAMRLIMRLAYATINPVTVMAPSDTIDGAGSTTMRWPFGVVASVPLVTEG